MGGVQWGHGGPEESASLGMALSDGHLDPGCSCRRPTPTSPGQRRELLNYKSKVFTKPCGLEKLLLWWGAGLSSQLAKLALLPTVVPDLGPGFGRCYRWPCQRCCS